MGFKKKIITNRNILKVLFYINYEETVESRDASGKIQIDEKSKKPVMVKRYPTVELIERFPTKAKWAFRTNLKKIEEANKTYTEVLQELEEKYIDDEHSFVDTQKDENGNDIQVRTVKDEYFEEFRKEKEELLDQENEISFLLINIDDIDFLDLSFNELDLWSFMIDEGVE